MSKKIKEKKYRLLVVAHPDDETLFFSAALMQKSPKNTQLPFKIICVTNGNADGAGNERTKQFQAACVKLNVPEAFQLDFPDIYEKRLDVNLLTDFLKTLPMPTEVYTHGIVGEYGHPHHQDVSFAVHQAFAKKVKIWVPAYNCEAEKVVSLSAADYKIKSKIYAEIYQGETLRFSQFIPNRNADEYTTLSLSEVQEVYSSMLEKRVPNKAKLKKYKWFYNFLAENNLKANKRPF